MSQEPWHTTGFVRDPATDWTVSWTQDSWHKIKGMLKFHPNRSYSMGKKYVNGVPVWGVSVPDLSTLTFHPEFEFAYEIWSSNVVSGDILGGILTQKGDHPMALWAGLKNSSDTLLAEYKTTAPRGPNHNEKVSTGIEIKPDTGIYTIEWSISRTQNDGTRDRQGAGTVEGRFQWDSNADALRMHLRAYYNI